MTARSLLSAAAFLGLAGSAAAGEVQVTADHSQVIKLDRPARTVLVGNPMIAEATMVDDRTIYVLGRMIGQTNVVAVDKEGTEVFNDIVSVRQGDQQIVTLHKGTVGPRTYSCAPRCEWMISPGDAEFKEIQEHADKKQALSEDAAKIASKPR